MKSQYQLKEDMMQILLSVVLAVLFIGGQPIVGGCDKLSGEAYGQQCDLEFPTNPNQWDFIEWAANAQCHRQACYAVQCSTGFYGVVKAISITCNDNIGYTLDDEGEFDLYLDYSGIGWTYGYKFNDGHDVLKATIYDFVIPEDVNLDSFFYKLCP
jgi:hypothetical protein